MINELNLIVANYHVIFAIIYFIFTSIFKVFFSVEFEIDWLIKLLGTIIGYLFHDIIIHSTIKNKTIYIKNLIKYFIIILFQNILSYMYLHESENEVFTLKNILKIEFYLFFYLIFDKFNNNFLEGDNKELFSDIIRICLTYLIVEKMFGKDLDKDDVIYIVSIIFGLVLFYKFINSYLIVKLKNLRKKLKNNKWFIKN
jgi:hypothetical protein